MLKQGEIANVTSFFPFLQTSENWTTILYSIFYGKRKVEISSRLCITGLSNAMAYALKIYQGDLDIFIICCMFY